MRLCPHLVSHSPTSTYTLQKGCRNGSDQLLRSNAAGTRPVGPNLAAAPSTVDRHHAKTPGWGNMHCHTPGVQACAQGAGFVPTHVPKGRERDQPGMHASHGREQLLRLQAKKSLQQHRTTAPNTLHAALYSMHGMTNPQHSQHTVSPRPSSPPCAP
jgi:hypothetical protein